MVTRRRALLVVSFLLVAAFAWSAWLAVQTARDLRDAQASVDRIRSAITDRDNGVRENAVADLQSSANSARDRTDGLWWGVMTLTPLIGDDAAGVRDLSSSLDVIASQAIDPLSDAVEDLDTIVNSGAIDVDKVAALQEKIAVAHQAFTSAARMVRSENSSGFAAVLRTRYDDYVTTVSDVAQDLGSAKTAVEVLPDMLGADEPRQYLFIFENNAEIRATGGLPGSWALVNADDGRLEMSLQGSAVDFDSYDDPIGNITSAEQALYGPEMGRFFQDANFTPDFPRAAQVFEAFWNQKYPRKPLDGVISIDVVGMSYLMDGLGPVQSGGLTLNADNVVNQLLSGVYSEPDPAKQDEIFRGVARSIFEAATSGPNDTVAFAEGMSRAAREGRFHVASFDEAEVRKLAETRVAGELSSDDGTTPHVDVALNDFTASKMSYYLRYTTEVRSLSCSDGVQNLGATITLSQTISPAEAATLPPYVTGSGLPGGKRGGQAVRVHVFAPFGGSVSDIKIDGEVVVMPEVVSIGGRPAVTLVVSIDSLQDVVVTLQMESGPGQDAQGVLSSTPGVVPGASMQSFAGSC